MIRGFDVCLISRDIIGLFGVERFFTAATDAVKNDKNHEEYVRSLSAAVALADNDRSLRPVLLGFCCALLNESMQADFPFLYCDDDTSVKLKQISNAERKLFGVTYRGEK